MNSNAKNQDSASQGQCSTNDGYDLKAEVQALDEIIAFLRARIEYREKMVSKRARERNFWDEFIDVNSTPMGHDYSAESTPWDLLSEAWSTVGTHLSMAMGSFRRATGG